MALHRAWGKLCESAAKGNADVGLLMRQYKSTRRERTPLRTCGGARGELTKTRETLRALEVKTRENARAYATAEAIIDEEADEKLTLRRKLKEATEERASSSSASRRSATRWTIFARLSSDFAMRCFVWRSNSCARGRFAISFERRVTSWRRRRERDERGQRLAHVDAECDMLAHMVRELRKSSGTDPREFMLAVERAIASHDDAPERRLEEVEQSSPSPPRSDIDEGYDTPDEDVDDGARDDARVSFVDDDFPSPPISGIVDATRTPDSAGAPRFTFKPPKASPRVRSRRSDANAVVEVHRARAKAVFHSSAFKSLSRRSRAMKHAPQPWFPIAASSVVDGTSARDCLVSFGADPESVDAMFERHPEVREYDVATEIAPRMSYLQFLEGRGELGTRRRPSARFVSLASSSASTRPCSSVPRAGTSP